MNRPSFTIGIEEEFQVVDPQTRELRSHISEMFAQGAEGLGERMKPELHQPVVEVGTGICENIGAALEDVRKGLAGPVPLHLRDGHYQGAAKLGHAQGYVYPHDLPEGIADGKSVEAQQLTLQPLSVIRRKTNRGHDPISLSLSTSF